MSFFRARWPAILLAGVGLAVVAGLGSALALYLAFFRDLPDFRGIADYRPALSSRLYDRHGEFAGQFFAERRRLTELDAIPQHVVHAFVAGEDSAFFEHAGVDFSSILRAAWVNLLAGGEVKQGGSTITQQMVKGLLLTPERTVRRKIREMILARRIEQRFTKQEILYLYLNQIYFGHGAYGVGEAARTYFGKDVSELSISEGATLAGLPKAPSRYSPFSNPTTAEKRRRYVIDRMLADDFIDEASHATAVADIPVLTERVDHSDFGAAAYFAEEVRRYLFDALGGDVVLRGGLVIETTMDLKLQDAAVTAVRRGLIDLDRRGGYRGPVRRVAEEEIPAELERLAEKNGFAAPDEEELAALAQPRIQTAPGDVEAPGIDEQISGAEWLGEGPYLGVVTWLAEDGKSARVGLAPDIEGLVRLKDVAWARPPDPTRSPYRMKSTRRIFQVGDVTWFSPLALGPGGEGASIEGVLMTLHQEPIAQGAVLSIEVATHDVLAMVGGYDFGDSEFNRVTQARRQPGSAFKPIIYSAALSKEYTPASIIHDRPVVYVDEESGFTWRPRNYKRSFYGPITLRVALARSVNNATVHLFRDLGVDYVIDYARRLGIESPMTRDLSLALGSSGVSLLELTRAYGVFAVGGMRVTPKFIRRVTDPEGNVLIENIVLGGGEMPEVEPPEDVDRSLIDVVDTERESEEDEAFQFDDPNRLISAELAYLTTDLLRAVVVDEDGTGWRLRALRRPVGGKTGTTNDQGDAWFMGFSPDIITGVWVGHDEKLVLGYGETGSKAAAPIWVDFMRIALDGRPRRDFEVPQPIVFARVDRKTGLLADGKSKDTVFQAFLTGTEPTESANTARTTSEGRRLLRMDSF